eukprot:scaffold38713_cov73-Phaeocystis_antarctica.AAC.1
MGQRNNGCAFPRFVLAQACACWIIILLVTWPQGRCHEQALKISATVGLAMASFTLLRTLYRAACAPCREPIWPRGDVQGAIRDSTDRCTAAVVSPAAGRGAARALVAQRNMRCGHVECGDQPVDGVTQHCDKRDLGRKLDPFQVTHQPTDAPGGMGSNVRVLHACA